MGYSITSTMRDPETATKMNSFLNKHYVDPEDMFDSPMSFEGGSSDFSTEDFNHLQAGFNYSLCNELHMEYIKGTLMWVAVKTGKKKEIEDHDGETYFINWDDQLELPVRDEVLGWKMKDYSEEDLAAWGRLCLGFSKENLQRIGTELRRLDDLWEKEP